MATNGFLSSRAPLPPGQTAGWQETHHYRNETLMDNWNEERFDNKWVMRPQCLPSDVNHYYTSTYQASYSSKPVPCNQQSAESSTDRVIRAFPHHQRELDLPGMKQQTDLFQSEHRTEYIDPRLRYKPLSNQKQT